MIKSKTYIFIGRLWFNFFNFSVLIGIHVFIHNALIPLTSKNIYTTYFPNIFRSWWVSFHTTPNLLPVQFKFPQCLNTWCLLLPAWYRQTFSEIFTFFRSCFKVIVHHLCFYVSSTIVENQVARRKPNKIQTASNQYFYNLPLRRPGVKIE